MTLTVDNACSNDTAIAYLVHHFKNGLVLDGKFVHVRCCAHILDLIVCDIMEDYHESISKIRNAVRFVRSTLERFSSFEKCIEEENLSSKSVVCLDLPNRWDYTYVMLEGAEKYEKAFERLGIHDTAYLEEDIPSSRDWEVVRRLVRFLSLFYEATLRLSGSLHVPSNVVFDEISSIQNFIKKCSSNSDDLVLKDMAMKMQAKYDKYWWNNENANYLLYVAVVLDPRYKLKFLSYCLSELFEANVAKEMCKKVEDILRQLFNEYSLSIVNNDSSTRGMARYSNAGESSTNDVTKAFHFKDMFDAMEEGKNFDAATEVDIYLLEPLVNQRENFDILKWWKYNSLRYKVLSKIAREILAIPVSTVASESAFNIRGRVVGTIVFASCPYLVEVLACAQNWLNKDPTRIDLRKHVQDLVRMEEGMGILVYPHIY